jgi:uncharacterized membrane protein (DUF485 family)
LIKVLTFTLTPSEAILLSPFSSSRNFSQLQSKETYFTFLYTCLLLLVLFIHSFFLPSFLPSFLAHTFSALFTYCRFYLLASVSTASIFIQSHGQERLRAREIMQNTKQWVGQDYSFHCNSSQSRCLKCVTLVATIQIALSPPKLWHHGDFVLDDRVSCKLRLNCSRY